MGWGIALLLVLACAVAAAFCTQLDKEKAAEKEFKKLLAELHEAAHNKALQQEFLHTVRKARFKSLSKKLSAQAYQAALHNLSANSEKPGAKTFALEVGRWHLGRSRPNGRATQADEQNIQADILTLSRMLVPSYQSAASWTE